ncbi:MAG: AAA family ATPase [Pseudomonadota bacterium]
MSFSIEKILDHFGLSKRPFSLAPDPDFLFLSAAHQRAKSALEYGLVARSPITLVTGAIGAGKTLLLRDFMNHIEEDLRIGLVANASPADRTEMLRLILYALGQKPPDGDSYATFYAALEAFLVDEYRDGRRVVLIFDEAQNLDWSSLEHLRMLTNINFAEHELVQLMLIGQSELRDMIMRPDLRQLAQRVSASMHLPGLSRDDVGSYITHRLALAGAAYEIFDEPTHALIYEATGGTPRLINQLCDYALLYAFAEGETTVTAEAVNTVTEDGVLLVAHGHQGEHQRAAE